MFKQQYDNDVTTWSPQGRLHQIEYAVEAVKQGSCVLAVVGKNCGVMAALLRRENDLSGYQQKMFKVDDHVYMGFSGLSSDARKLHKEMKSISLDHRYMNGLNNVVNPIRLAQDISYDNHYKTITTQGRPVGVGTFVLGLKDNRASLCYLDPRGDCQEYWAHAIGARSQSARTFLEKELDNLPEMEDVEALIQIAIGALDGSTDASTELSSQNTVLAIVSPSNCTMVQGDDMEPLLDIFNASKATMDDEEEEQDEAETEV